MGVLIAVLTFLVVVVLILGIWVFASGEGAQEQVRKRMHAAARSAGQVPEQKRIYGTEHQLTCGSFFLCAAYILQ